jgi:tetratricopeptide (TPR) repeat protein
MSALLEAHKYAEAVDECQRQLSTNADDIGAVETMALALRAMGRHNEALSLFERAAAHDKEDTVANALAPGRATWQIDIACLHWLLDDRPKAIHLMHGLVAGILDGSIGYGDVGGGISQGLLLHYMAITAGMRGEVSFARSYLRNRVNRLKKLNPWSFGETWPCPVAQYYLGDLTSAALIEAVDRKPSVTLAVQPSPAMVDLSRRRRLSVALFHDGAKSRAQGNEAYCLARMRECYALENPLLEQEWYLARYEVEKVDKTN